jgi:ABC-type Fe3+ transport system substrate-binding protein
VSLASWGCSKGDNGSSTPTATKAEPDAATADRLVIYSPHSDAIKQEFRRAFGEAHRSSTGRAVTVEWPDAGGGGGILRQLQDKYKQGIHDVDVVFGGGPMHEQLKNAGLLQPYKLPDDLLAKLPRTIAGQPLYDAEHYWYGAAISSFGIIYNKPLVADLGAPPVAEWSDMARPQFFAKVGVVDAGQSGSVRKAYEIILQSYGYEKGLRVLTLMGANARGIGRSSSEIPKDCAQGFIALGACIDFYGSRQMASPGGEVLGFVLPKGLTVINTDPISILRDAPHRAVAEEFVRFVMSPAGQKLWSLRQGAPGGPQKETLGRYAVLPEIYRDYAADLAPGLESPLDAPATTFYDSRKEGARIEVLPAYLKALMVTNKRPLSDAWRAVIAAGTPEDLTAELTAPLIDEKEMLRLAREVWAPVVIKDETPEADRARLLAERDRRLLERSNTELAWTIAFRERYEAVARAARKRVGK